MSTETIEIQKIEEIPLDEKLLLLEKINNMTTDELKRLLKKQNTGKKQGCINKKLKYELLFYNFNTNEYDIISQQQFTSITAINEYIAQVGIAYKISKVDDSNGFIKVRKLI
jgi:hypothetical protein